MQLVRTSPTSKISCPCCHGDHQHTITPDSIYAPSKVLVSLLDNLLVTCKKCSKTVRAGDHTSHILKGCKEHTQVVSPVSSEERVASTVIKRKLSESKDGTISVPTAGKVGTSEYPVVSKYNCTMP